MTERELRALAAYVDFPAERDLAPAVRARLATGRRPRRRPLVLVLAALLVALAVAFAVPPARSAILRFFHLRGVSIELVDRLPEVRGTAPLDLGAPISLGDAAQTTGFEPLRSNLLGDPDGVTWDGGMLWFRYGDVRLLVSQFQGSERIELVKKVVEPRTTITPVTVAGQQGYFLSGASHFLYLAPNELIRDERVRLARNVLLWQHGRLTLRLEGDLTVREALVIARSFG
jgi:hypothetical protein